MKPFIPREWMRMRKQPDEHPWSRLSSYKMHMTIKQTSKGPYLRVCHTIKENPIPDGVQWIKAPYSPGEVCWVSETYRAWFPCDADGQPIDDHWHVRYKDGTERITGAGWDEGPDYLAPDDVGLDKEPVKWRSPATMPQWAARRHVRILSCVPEHRGEWGWRMEWEESNAL